MSDPSRPERGGSSEIESRAKDLLPQVLLTLISIVQALALEVLWSSVNSQAHLWAPGPSRWIGWLQVAATLEIIVLVWLFFVHLLLRFRWVPTVRDSVMPFVFGVGEFTAAQMLGAEYLAHWFFLIAALFSFAQWATVGSFRVARQDPDNDWYFHRLPEGREIVHTPWLVTVSVFLGFGTWIAIAGPTGAVAMVGIVSVNVIVLLQLFMQHFFWTRSLRLLRPRPPTPARADDD